MATKPNRSLTCQNRSIRCLEERLGHNNLAAIEIKDVGQFRGHLFSGGVPSSSIKRIFSLVNAMVNMAIRENGLNINNVFSGTFIPEDEEKKRRLFIPNDFYTSD